MLFSVNLDLLFSPSLALVYLSRMAAMPYFLINDEGGHAGKQNQCVTVLLHMGLWFGAQMFPGALQGSGTCWGIGMAALLCAGCGSRAASTQTSPAGSSMEVWSEAEFKLKI